MKKKYKIGLLVPTLSNGGAERVVSNLSIELAPYYDVYVIVFDNSNQTYSVGGKLIDLHLPSQKGLFKKAFTLFRRINAVKKTKRELQLDCCISFMSGPSYVNTCTGKKSKTIVSVRNNMTLSEISKFERGMIVKSCKAADAVVSLSETVKRDLISNFGIPEPSIVTIYNSVDGKRLLELCKDGEMPEALRDTKYIVNVGRITKQKGQWHLIRAFSDLVKKHEHLKLVILGQGEETFVQRLIALTNKLGISDKVLFLGYIKNPHFIISKAEAFVFSSLFEGLGNSLLEALACKKAVVSTDCVAGPREILAPKTDFSISERGELKTIEFAEYGVLTPAFPQNEDVDDADINDEERMLSTAIDALLSDNELKKRYECKSSERVNCFSPNSIAKQWVGLIDEVIER